jgi:class 3 adenylate cyclase
MMCVFRDEPSALRAARELQGSIDGFNSARNRLGQPFTIRCGVTSGTVALEPGTPIGHLNSPVLDRAAALQKRAAPGDIVVGAEVAAAALVELGAVAALPDTLNGERVFSWRAAAPR